MTKSHAETGVKMDFTAKLHDMFGLDGRKDVLGICIEKNEGAKFWLSVFTELTNRGVQDVLIDCVDGPKGLPEAIE